MILNNSTTLLRNINENKKSQIVILDYFSVYCQFAASVLVNTQLYRNLTIFLLISLMVTKLPSSISAK